MNSIKMERWFRKRETRRVRLVLACVSILIIIIAGLVLLSAVLPSTIMTFGGHFSFRTPNNFKVGSMYSFDGTQGSKDRSVFTEEEGITYGDDRAVSFKYPQIISLGPPSYRDEHLLQSMNFSLENPKADGLIQIWELTIPVSDLLNRTIESYNLSYLSFKKARSEINGLSCMTWDYAFKNGETAIHALEAFVTDDKRLYRISLFTTEEQYGKAVIETFDAMIDSVRIE